MKNRQNDILAQVVSAVQDMIINFNKEKWNFYTNATSENRKRYIGSINEFISYLNTNPECNYILGEFKKNPAKFRVEEQKSLNKIKDLCAQYHNKTELLDTFMNSLINTEMEIIDDRVSFNNKESTTSHLADLAEHETSLSDIIKLQKLFFSPVKKMSTHFSETIKLRNEYFKEHGYESFFDYFAKSHNTYERRIRALIERVDKLTIEPYKKIKSDLDDILEKKLKSHSQRKPSYIYGDPFFRFYPVHADDNVNLMFKGKDVAYAGKKFFEHMGINLDDIYEVSDLYIRPGKYQGNVVVDIDRAGDVRFSVNSKSNFRGMYYLLRTLSKVIFTINYNPDAQFLTRTVPNRGLAEGFGMYLTEYAFKSGYISKTIAQYEDEDAQMLINVNDYVDKNKIIYIRFFLALADFEIQLNSNPDIDAPSVWAKLLKKYQLIDIDTMIEKEGYVMIDSIIVDPFSSIFELEGYVYSLQIEKKLNDKSMTGRHRMKYLLTNIVQNCNLPLGE